MPAARWEGNCHAVAHRLIDAGLVAGRPRYGLYFGPVRPGGCFSPTAPFHRHGWIELPGGKALVDPTRWAFERVSPYLFAGPYTAEYDPGMQNLRLLQTGPCPGRMPGDEAFVLALSAAAAAHLADMTGSGREFGLGQLFWVANLPLFMLGPHAAEVFRALDAIGKKTLVPIDSWELATGLGGPPPHIMRNPRAD
jgi:hypothetical protein